MDWNSSALWGITGLIGGVIVSSFFFFIGLKRKRLSYCIDTFCIIYNKASQITDLKIKYHHAKLKHLYHSKITIINTGNSIIEYQDFAPSYLPFLSTDGQFITNSTDPVTANERKDFILTYNSNNDTNRLYLKFDYISKKLYFRFFILGIYILMAS